MRLGKRRTVFKTADSVLRQMYGNTDTIEERHRHRYEVGIGLHSKHALYQVVVG